MKNDFCSKKASILFLLILFLLPNISLAQGVPGAENFNEEKQAEPFNQPPVYKAPIDLEIRTVTFIEKTRKLQVETVIINNKDHFVALDKAILSLFKGDYLNDNGYVFNGMELSYYAYAELDFLAPKESRKKTFEFDIPKNLEAANYFAQLRVSDREFKNFGADHYEEAVAINGSGGFLGSIDAFVRAAGSDQPLMAGQMLGREDEISVIIPTDDKIQSNKKLLDHIVDKEILIKASIYSISDKELIKEFIVDGAQNIDDEISVDFLPWEGLETGTLNLVLELLNDKNEMLASPIQARWFRSDQVARIVKIDTGTNYYKAGDNLDLVVTGAFLGFEDGRMFNIEVLLKGNKGERRFEEAYVYGIQKSEEFEFDFSEKTIDAPFKTSEIVVELRDAESGELIDQNSMSSDTNGNYVKGNLYKEEKKSESVAKPLDGQDDHSINLLLAAFLISLGVLIMIIAFRRSAGRVSVFALLIIFSVFVFGVGDAQAACEAPAAICGEPPFPIQAIWSSFDTPPSGYLGASPQSISVTNVYAYIHCQTCLNGIGASIGLEVQKSDGSPVGETCADVAYYGHVYHWDPGFNYPGPYNFNYTFNSAGDYRYRIVLNSSDGCKCEAASWKSGWYYVSVSGSPSCNISIPSDNSDFLLGNPVDFNVNASAGHLGSISRYYWGRVRPGTPSYNETTCHIYNDAYDYSGDGHGDQIYYPITNQKSYSITNESRLPLGSSKVCVSVRQTNPDGTYSWCSDHVDINIKEKPKCGPAKDVPSTTKPSAGLCSVGSASVVNASTGYWRWNCIKDSNTVPCTAPDTRYTFSAPSYIKRGTKATLEWTTNNVDWCYGYDSGNALWDTNQTHFNNTFETWEINNTTQFGFYCNKLGYDESSTKRLIRIVQVYDLDFYVNDEPGKASVNVIEGDSLKFNWEPLNLSSCEAHNTVIPQDPLWMGTKSSSLGSSLSFVPSGDPGNIYQYFLVCKTGDDQEVTRSINVNIKPCDESTCVYNGVKNSYPCTSTDCASLGCETDPDCRNNEKEFSDRVSSCGYVCGPVETKSCSCGSSIGADEVKWDETKPGN